jgi:peptide/nickel transport system substrate-binding protein
MKRFARTSAVLAVGGLAAITALSACGSSTSSGRAVVSGAFGSIPPEHGTPTGTGTLNLPEFAGVPPTWIFPVTNSANNSIGSVTLFQYFMWRPLWWSPNGNQQVIDYPLSLADKPTITNGGKTFTFSLNPAYKWSNGQPITANDVLFDFDLIKAAIAENPANYAAYVPGQFPANATFKELGPSTMSITFTKTYNPGWAFWDEVGQLIPLPSTEWNVTSATSKHVTPAVWETLKGAEGIYNYLSTLSGDKGTYATNPIWQTVDGPFKLTSFNSTSGSFSMVPNANYGGPVKAKFSTLNMIFYTDETAEYDAALSGALSIAYLPFQNLPQLKSLKSKGYEDYGYPGMGFNYIAYNFKDTTGHWNDIIAQLYVRQALAHLQNESAEIKGIFLGAAIPAYTTIPSLPKTAYIPAASNTDPYPFDPAETVSMLKAHGWKVVPGGQTTCQKAGSASDECGAGIPAGTPLSFNLPYSTTPSWIGELIDSLASTAKQDAGITVTPEAKTFTFIVQNYNNPVPSDAKYINSWNAVQFGGYTENGYPTSNQIFNTGGGGNFGSFSNPAVDGAINGSLNSPSSTALINEGQTVAEQQPGLFEPLNDNIIIWKNSVSGPAQAFQIFTQYEYLPEEFYFTK